MISFIIDRDIFFAFIIANEQQAVENFETGNCCMGLCVSENQKLIFIS